MLKSVAAAAAGALLLGLLGPTPAHALDPELPFTADSLSTWQTDGVVWGMASAQGKVFAGGTFTQVRPPGALAGDAASQNRTNLAVLDAATGIPTDCVLNVTRGTASATVRAITASPDGSVVYIGGLFSQVNGANRLNVAAINVATCTVLPFNPTTSGFVYAIAATATKVYVGGSFLNLRGQSRPRLGAVTAATVPAGSADGALLPWAPVVEDEIFALAVEPSTGNVVLGGRMDFVNNQDSHDLAVVDGETGTTNVKNYPQPFFPYSEGQGQRAGNTAIKAIATDATGFYIGAEGAGFAIFDGRAAFNWGTYEQRWRDTCLGATQALAVHDGVLFNGNHVHDCESEGLFEDGLRWHLNAQRTDNEKLLPWWPNTNGGIGEALGPRSINVASSGADHYLWYGGEFTTVNGVKQQGLTRFGQGPDVTRPATPATPNVSSTTSGEVRVMWRATTDNDDKTLTYTLYRNTSATPIATLTADSQFFDKPQLSYTETGLTPGTTHSYRVVASDGTNISNTSVARSVTVAGPSNDYANTVVSDGASVYFRMEEPDGTAAASLGSSTLGGTYVSGPTRVGQASGVVTQPGTSALFDGVEEFLRTDQRQPAPTVYSEELWFKTSTTSGGRLIGYGNEAMVNGVPKTSPNSTKYDRHIYMTDAGKLVFGTHGASRVTLTSPASYNNDAWHHVVATQGPSGMTLYVDGKQVASNTVSSAMALNGYWRVGGDGISTAWSSAPTSGFFAGNIDEAAIYPTVLSSAQVADHWTRGGGVDTTGPPAPVVSPASGDYAGAQSVTMSTSEAEAVIRYTVGTGTTVPEDPTTASARYTGPIEVDASQVVKAAAFDALGNRSEITQRDYTIFSGRTVTLNAVADTMVRQGSPTSAYGATTGLKADTQATTGNTTSRDTTYVRFTVPALAAGESIRSAELSVNVTNPTSNGPAVWRTGTTWTESTMTWNSGQPARSGTAAAGNYAAMAAGRVRTPVTGVTASGAVSFQLYADSSDGLDISSRETTSRPQLVLAIESQATPPPAADTTAPPAPTVTPGTGTYPSAQSVTMSDSEPDAVIRYTVGAGTTVPADPTATSREYTGAFEVGASQVVKAAAFDSAGNRSAITRRDYTISAGGTRTVTLDAVADTMVRQSRSTTASGAATVLKSDTQATTGNAATRDTSYLRFTVPALAAGESIRSAQLSVNVTNPTSNGPAVWRTGTTWTESTMTWSSGQPARSGTAAVGNYAAMAAGRVRTPVTGVTASGAVSFQLYADSGDGLDISSRETTTRPQLVLTIETP